MHSVWGLQPRDYVIRLRIGAPIVALSAGLILLADELRKYSANQAVSRRRNGNNKAVMKSNAIDDDVSRDEKKGGVSWYEHVPPAIVALFGLVGTYLWVADAAGTRPDDTNLLGILLSLFSLAAVLGILPPLIWLVIKLTSNK